MMRKVMLFLALVGCAAAAIDKIDTCIPGGEYCLNHWDCCSNTCLSYLYKCSRIQHPRPAFGSVQTSIPLFAPAPITSFDPHTESVNSLIELVFRPLIVSTTSGRDVNTLESRFGEDKPEHISSTTEHITTTTEGPQEPQCKEIGLKCYTNDECCSSRCHGFLHQCVT